jgi:hypothetical protein
MFRQVDTLNDLSCGVSFRYHSALSTVGDLVLVENGMCEVVAGSIADIGAALDQNGRRLRRDKFRVSLSQTELFAVEVESGS